MPLVHRALRTISCLVLVAGAINGQSLSLVEEEITGSLVGVRALALVPDGTGLLAVSSGEHALISYAVDPITGELTWLDEAVDGVGGVDGLRQAFALSVSPDGLHAYAVARNDDAVSAFARDPGTGALTFVEAEVNEVGGVDGIWRPRGVAVAGGGGFVVASGRKSPSQPKGAVVLFERDGTTGELEFLHALYDDLTPGVSGLGLGGAVHVGPDGESVYVASATGSVLLFDLDPALSELSWVATWVDGTGGVDGIGGASSIAFSPDGLSAYVTGETDGAVAVFDRDADSGELSFVEAFFDGIGGVDGLAGASGVTVSPGGDRVYVTGLADDAVAIFARGLDGRLTPIEVARDGVGGLDGLAGALSPRVSAAGTTLFVGASLEAGIGVFEIGDAFDFGDAPDPSFPTLLASDGARHVISAGLWLGAGVDAEADGQPDATASGDDVGGTDDESGVVFAGAMIPGQPATVEVSASTTALLDAWIDFDDDGDWSSPEERIAAGVALAAGVNSVGFAVPTTAAPDSAVFARFRVSSAGVSAPTGLAADGEVEDYLVPIGRGADLGVVAAGTPGSDWMLPWTFTVTVGSAGPNDVTGAEVAIGVSANGGPFTWTCVAAGGSCSAGGAGDVADLVDLVPGGSAVYTLSGTVPDEAPGPDIVATATVTAPVGVTDPVSTNDSATAGVRILSIFLDDFETGDVSRWSSALP